jgi:hypothetical protein
MLYKIIITKDGKHKKLIYEGRDKKHAKKKYFSIKDNNKVLTPKRTNAYKKTKPVIYELLLLKEKEENDPKFYSKDELGRNIEVNVKSDKWVILHKDEYFYEEKFTVFGYDKRLETKEIIKLILLRRHKGILLKQVNYVVNKVLIHQDGGFDIIVCKTKSDAKKLYKILQEFYESNNRIKNILFTGLVSKRNRTELYKKIVEKTGWTLNRVYRSSSRP